MDTPLLESLPPDTPFSNALTCQKCGSHDPSVRQVIYPYVISLIAITYRREFHGRWCRKHRTPYLLLAALITGTIGWFGFHVGLIYTPVTLYHLITGKVMHKASNLKLMRSLGESYQQRGLLDGARRCLENGLQFVDDLWGRQQLEGIYALPTTEPKTHPGRWFQSSYAAVGLLFCAVILSGLAGFFSHYVDKLYDLPMGNLIQILGPTFLWMAFAITCLALIFILRQIQEKVLEEHLYQSRILILGLGFIAGIVAAFGFLEGRQIGNFIDILLEHPILPSAAAFWVMLGAVFTRGGLLDIPQELRGLEFSNFPHHFLLAAIPVLFPAALTLAAWPYLAWEKLLNELHTQVQPGWKNTNFTSIGRLAPFAGFLCLAGILFPFHQQSIVDFIEARDHFYAGNELAYQGRYDGAIAEYKIAVQLDPLDAPAYVELGWAYYEQDDNLHAIAQYAQSIQLDPNRADSHYDLGRIYYHDDQPEKAALEFEKTLQIDPTYYQAYLGIGWVAYDQGNLDKAEANFRKVLEYDNKNYDAYVGLGYIYEDRDQVDQEIAAYQKAVESDSASAEANSLLGMAYYDKNEMDLAVTSLEKAVSLESTDQLARLYLTQAYVYTGQPDTAVTFSRDTLKLLPNWAGAHALLAYSLIETRQLDAAIAEIQAAQGIIEKDDADRRLIIRDWLNADRPAEAEAEAQAAVKDSQHPANFYLYLAEAYSDQKKYSLALTVCDQAEKAGARRVDVLTQRASIHLDADQSDLSQEELQQAITLEPKSEYAHYLLSLVYTNQQNYASALNEAQQAVSVDHYYYNAYMQLAAAQLALRNSQDAITAASRAALLSPYTDVPHYFLGMSYLQEGLDQFASSELKKFLDLYEGYPSEETLKKDAEDALNKLKITF